MELRHYWRGSERPRSLAMQKWKSIAFGLVATVAALFGQGNTGSIVGTVTDPSGALIPGVEIAITNLNTGVSTPATTDSAGAFAARYIVAGVYKVQATATGFRPFLRDGIAL